MGRNFLAIAVMKTMKKYRQGFTLIEVVIVMGVLALLAALVIGAILVARKQTATAVLKTDAKNIRDLLEAYNAKYKTYPLPGNTRTNAYELFGSNGNNASTSIPDSIAKQPTVNNPRHQLQEFVNSSFPTPPSPGDGSTGLICYSSGGSDYWLWVINKEERDNGIWCGNGCTGESNDCDGELDKCGFCAVANENKMHCPAASVGSSGCTSEFSF